MNHLAHLFLAPDSPEARVGSLLGDFTRGVDLAALPQTVRFGVRHHLAVDTFTDRHPDVLASKRLFSGQRRKFAGVALDILYDHFLLCHWSEFTDTDPNTFIRDVYKELQANEDLMTPDMSRTTRHMVAHDWFGSYRSLDNIGYALDRVAARIRFQNSFTGIINEIRPLHSELEEHFLSFFPDLQEFAGGIE
ncbi:ACP phosphodiesterase [Marinobacter sp. 2_MG-2023]|uniref:acyl carrier protein phosphodiesterase n=1 Tax=Marinobacter sp. 2_MG-2023 TaxID=3062679 RepID=UPI0026E42B21|nr:ACP phosphodiesterase [Marinobacter sp. 2_MG-2023]MDO6442342.1 ACP phosphodiesterase [Marinobacter sp. 2_MG-2023]